MKSHYMEYSRLHDAKFYVLLRFDNSITVLPSIYGKNFLK